MPAGAVLRELLKNYTATVLILYDDLSEGLNGHGGIQLGVKQSGKGVFWKFFNWIDKGSFEVGADAFTTFRVSQIFLSGRAHNTDYLTGAIDEAQRRRSTISSNKLRPFL